MKDQWNAVRAAQTLTYFGLDDPATLEHQLESLDYDFGYAYDPRHQLTGVSEALGRFSAAYDFTPAGKLASAQVGATAAAGGNVVDRDVTYSYLSSVDPEAPAALVPVGGGANVRSYLYDTVGNLTARAAGEGDPEVDPTDTFAYDGDDQLRRSKAWDGATLTGVEEYYYDQDGDRFAVVTRDAADAVTSVRLFLDDTELEMDPATGAVAQAYAYLSMGTPVAKVVSPAGGWDSGAAGTPWWNASALELQYHGLGNSTLLSIRPDLTVQSGYVYGPYGEVVEAVGTTAGLEDQRRRFNDKVTDDQTGLHYYGVRYYDDVALGWTQADPLYRFVPDAAWTEPRKANLYQFVLANPLRYMDPDGRNPLLEPHVAVVAAGAVALYGLVYAANPDAANRMATSARRAADAAHKALLEPSFNVREMAAAVQAEIHTWWGGVQAASGATAAAAAAVVTQTRTGKRVTVRVDAEPRAIPASPPPPCGDGPHVSLIDRDVADKVRESHWKKAAEERASEFAEDNLERMRVGLAPIGADGYPMELHHEGQRPDGRLLEMTRTDHRLGDNYKKNHPCQ